MKAVLYMGLVEEKRTVMHDDHSTQLNFWAEQHHVQLLITR